MESFLRNKEVRLRLRWCVEVKEISLLARGIPGENCFGLFSLIIFCLFHGTKLCRQYSGIMVLRPYVVLYAANASDSFLLMYSLSWTKSHHHIKNSSSSSSNTFLYHLQLYKLVPWRVSSCFWHRIKIYLHDVLISYFLYHALICMYISLFCPHVAVSHDWFSKLFYLPPKFFCINIKTLSHQAYGVANIHSWLNRRFIKMAWSYH